MYNVRAVDALPRNYQWSRPDLFLTSFVVATRTRAPN